MFEDWPESPGAVTFRAGSGPFPVLGPSYCSSMCRGVTAGIAGLSERINSSASLHVQSGLCASIGSWRWTLQNRQNLPDRLGSMLKKSKSKSRHEWLALAFTGWGLDFVAFAC